MSKETKSAGSKVSPDINAMIEIAKETNAKKHKESWIKWTKIGNDVIEYRFTADKDDPDKKYLVTYEPDVAKNSRDVEFLSRSSAFVERLIGTPAKELGCLYVQRSDLGDFKGGDFPSEDDAPCIGVEITVKNAGAGDGKDKAGTGVAYEVSCRFRCYDTFEDKPVLAYKQDSFIVKHDTSGYSYAYTKIDHFTVNDKEEQEFNKNKESLAKNDGWEKEVKELQNHLAGDEERNSNTHKSKIISMIANNENSVLHNYIKDRIKALKGLSADEMAMRLSRGMQIAMFTDNLYLNRMTEETRIYVFDGEEEYPLTVNFKEYPNPTWEKVRVKPRDDGKGVGIVEKYDEREENLQEGESFLGDAQFVWAYSGDGNVYHTIYDANLDVEEAEEKYSGCDAVDIKYVDSNDDIIDDFGLRKDSREIMFYDEDQDDEDDDGIYGAYALALESQSKEIVYYNADDSEYMDTYALNVQTVEAKWDNGTRIVDVDALECQTIDIKFVRNGRLVDELAFDDQVENILYENKFGDIEEDDYGLPRQAVSIQYGDGKNIYDRKAFSISDIVESVHYVRIMGGTEYINGRFFSSQTELLPFNGERWYKGNLKKAKAVVNEGGMLKVKDYASVPDVDKYKPQTCAYCGQEMYVSKENEKILTSVDSFFCPSCRELVSAADPVYVARGEKRALIYDGGRYYIEENAKKPEQTTFCHHSGCSNAEHKDSKEFSSCPQCGVKYCPEHSGSVTQAQNIHDKVPSGFKNGYCRNCGETGKIEKDGTLYNKIKHNIDLRDRRKDMTYFWDKSESELLVYCGNNEYRFAVFLISRNLEENRFAFTEKR